MTKKTPVLQDKVIAFWDEYEERFTVTLNIANKRDRQAFWEILEDYSGFRFVGNNGTSCTMVKEMRPQFGNKKRLKPIWYAHKRLDGKLKRKYIGKVENITYEKLKAVAFELCQRSLV